VLPLWALGWGSVVWPIKLNDLNVSITQIDFIGVWISVRRLDFFANLE
jgi:hypothetical protein